MSSELIAIISTAIGLAVFIRIGNRDLAARLAQLERAIGTLRERVARLEGKLEGIVAARRDGEAA
ncbi:MAG: hypothetical protein OXG72_10005 [Acidobacteria bacterium]|nr:hypothetical protein [Acidobacteriota bacterium]